MNQYISKIISVSRFPLICGVVMIHSQIFDSSLISIFCGEIFGRICVPFFYMISGFLFFQHYDNSVTTYKAKIRKRIRTLLIPYLIWNTIAYIVYAYGTKDMHPNQFLESFWVVAGKGGHSPADGPLWFLRTLICLSVIAPIFYLINKWRYTAWLSPLLIVAWLFDVPGFQSGTIIGICWFNIGVWVHCTEIKNTIKEPSYIVAIAIIACYFVLALIELLFFNSKTTLYHNSVIIVGMLLFYALPKFSYSRLLEYIGGGSFFMYCLHEMIIESFRYKISFSQSILNSCKYVIVITSTIILCMLIYYTLRRFCPRILLLLSGNR